MSTDTGGKYPQSFRSEEGNTYAVKEVTELYSHLPALVSEPGSHWFRMTGKDSDGNELSRDFGQHGGGTYTQDDANPTDLDTVLLTNARLLDKEIAVSNVKASRFKDMAPIEEVGQPSLPLDSVQQKALDDKVGKSPVKAEVSDKPKPSPTANDTAVEKL